MDSSTVCVKTAAEAYWKIELFFMSLFV